MGQFSREQMRGGGVAESQVAPGESLQEDASGVASRVVEDIVQMFGPEALELLKKAIALKEGSAAAVATGSTPSVDPTSIVPMDVAVDDVVGQDSSDESDKSDKAEEVSGHGSSDGHSDNSGSGSQPSNPEVQSLREREILVTHTVEVVTVSDNKSRATVKFSINSGQRAKTYLSPSQGDHVSSYLFLIYSLLSGIKNERGIDEAIMKMKYIGNKLLPKEAREKLQSMAAPSLLPRSGRRLALEAVQEEAEVTLDNGSLDSAFKLRESVRNDLLFAKITKKADYLGKIASFLLTEIQKDPLATIYSKGRVKRTKDGKAVESDDEGAVVKKSARGLMLLDSLYYLYNLKIESDSDGKAFDERMNNFIFSLSLNARRGDETEEDHLSRYGFSAWLGDGIGVAEALKNQLTTQRERGGDYRSAQKQSIKGMIGQLLDIDERECKVSEFMGGLFDYDKEVEFNCKRAFPITVQDKRQIVEAGARGEEGLMIKHAEGAVLAQIKDRFESKVSSEQCNFSNVEVSADGEISGNVVVERNNLESLAEVVIRHQDMMDMFCFNISKFNERGYELMKKQFVEREVLGKGGWEGSRHQVNVEIERSLQSRQQETMQVS